MTLAAPISSKIKEYFILPSDYVNNERPLSCFEAQNNERKKWNREPSQQGDAYVREKPVLNSIGFLDEALFFCNQGCGGRKTKWKTKSFHSSEICWTRFSSHIRWWTTKDTNVEEDFRIKASEYHRRLTSKEWWTLREVNRWGRTYAIYLINIFYSYSIHILFKPLFTVYGVTPPLRV